MNPETWLLGFWVLGPRFWFLGLGSQVLGFQTWDYGSLGSDSGVLGPALPGLLPSISTWSCNEN